MIQFELRSVVNSTYREEEINGVAKVIFTSTPVVGIVGNTYPGFTDTSKEVETICDKTDTGVAMEAAVNATCAAYVTATFPPIP